MPSHPLYHLYRQKKLVKLRRPLFPERWVKILDKIAMLVAILGPIFTLPQIYKIYALQNVEGLSLISWGSYLVFNIPMLLYGIVHCEKMITRMYFLWILVNGSIVAGIILFH
ncbi:MAG: PQ-loop domain-containing transporter [Patescibacteria group bacterium]